MKRYFSGREKSTPGSKRRPLQWEWSERVEETDSGHVGRHHIKGLGFVP